MPNKITTHFFNEIKFLSAAIGVMNLPSKIFKAAKEQDVDRYKIIREEFKKDNPKLQERICKLYGDYVWESCPTIFFDKEDFSEEDEELFLYDSTEINPINLITIIILSNGAMEETCMFMNPMELQDAIAEQSENELAEYMENYSVETFLDLVEVFYKK